MVDGEKQFMQSEDSKKYHGRIDLENIEGHFLNWSRDIVAKLARKNKSSKDVLDFGAGLGTLAFLWEELTAIRPECVELDEEQAAHIRSRGYVCYHSISEICKKFDIVYSSNVLEHIEDDVKILKEIHSLLKPDACLALYLPACSNLYSLFDKEVGHYRRYDKAEILEKLNAAGFRVKTICFADFLGYFVMYFTRGKKVMRNTLALSFYNHIIFPVSCLLDFLGAKWIIGKNILVYAYKYEPK